MTLKFVLVLTVDSTDFFKIFSVGFFEFLREGDKVVT